jgi:hypothetical protein
VHPSWLRADASRNEASALGCLVCCDALSLLLPALLLLLLLLLLSLWFAACTLPAHVLPEKL